MAQLTANKCGRIQAIVGPMFSGKTEELIRRLGVVLRVKAEREFRFILKRFI